MRNTPWLQPEHIDPTDLRGSTRLHNAPDDVTRHRHFKQPVAGGNRKLGLKSDDISNAFHLESIDDCFGGHFSTRPFGVGFILLVHVRYYFVDDLCSYRTVHWKFLEEIHAQTVVGFDRRRDESSES